MAATHINKKMKRRLNAAIILCLTVCTASAQTSLSKVWVADLGNGEYQNPILHADYSDPDAIRVGDDYYMTSSSFEDIPGLPILHSKDLVNWQIIGHALPALTPGQHFKTPRHGDGVWAPSLRYHNNEFYLYYPDPDFGIYLLKAKDPKGPWSAPILVEGGKGLIDPCPIWQNNKAYLVHAYAGSRAGIKSVLVVKEMSWDGTKTISSGSIVYDGHDLDPTIEGPKIYFHNGYFYILAPAGGVSTGWQLALRSRSIYGPYERKVVMDQGKSTTNGPHQGAWVTTQTGEDWFLHFQDKEAYGRVVHLQPMEWKNGWPVIGVDADGDGKGEPVVRFKKPNVGKSFARTTPVESDEFSGNVIGRQWQWMANAEATWAFPFQTKGCLRLFSVQQSDSSKNLWGSANILQQKFPAEEFVATAKLEFFPNKNINGERAGLCIMGLKYSGLCLEYNSGEISLLRITCDNSEKEKEKMVVLQKQVASLVYLRVKISAGARCVFSYSADGSSFTEAPGEFMASPGKWKGAKIGLFCNRYSSINDAGWVDVDWFRIEK